MPFSRREFLLLTGSAFIGGCMDWQDDTGSNPATQSIRTGGNRFRNLAVRSLDERDATLTELNPLISPVIDILDKDAEIETNRGELAFGSAISETGGIGTEPRFIFYSKDNQVSGAPANIASAIARVKKVSLYSDVATQIQIFLSRDSFIAAMSESPRTLTDLRLAGPNPSNVADSQFMVRSTINPLGGTIRILGYAWLPALTYVDLTSLVERVCLTNDWILGFRVVNAAAVQIAGVFQWSERGLGSMEKQEL